ncbi:MAG: hypothetical protein BWK78_09575 [Thiotrichaceae bacterium IS1]|nr:MAG: hypothetical protein BWK78_09575 [Thiotrichaceae bacterium IS1]
MNELRTYLLKYVQDLNDILSRSVDDNTIVDLAEEKWVPEDIRLLVIKATGFRSQRFRTLSDSKIAEISVNLVNTDNKMITVNLDNTITAQEVIIELIVAEFIIPNLNGYQLFLKASCLPDNQSFGEIGVRNGDTIKVVPGTTGGGYLDSSTLLSPFAGPSLGTGGSDTNGEQNKPVGKADKTGE